MKNITYINAGAGSGKTHELISLFTGLVADGKATPDQVIMTTFSERAAAEIKERAKEGLIAQGFTDESLAVEHAAIGTVHGIAYQFIRKYWFRLGLAPDIKVMDDNAKGVYVSQSLANLPTPSELSLLHDFARVFSIKNGSQLNLNFWREQLTRIIDLSSNYEVTDYATSLRKSLELVRSLIDPTACSSLPDDDLAFAIDSLTVFWEDKGTSKTNIDRLDALRRLKATLKRRDLTWYSELGAFATSYRKKSVDDRVVAIVGAAASVIRSEFVYAKVSAYLELIFDLAARWSSKYEHFKAQKNVLDYNDMEKYMLLLLKDDIVEADVAASFKYLFVDEYQDCSPIQVRIFDRLSDIMTRSYWVGDVKQAIYAFRGSATELTQAVMQKIAGGGDGFETKSLGKSYRSLPPIVRVCNNLFPKVYEGVISPENITLEPHRTEDPDFTPSLRYWDLTNHKNQAHKAVAIAAQVADLVAQGVRPSDIAVLARRNDQLASIAEVLVPTGIPVSLAQQDVTELAATDLLLAVLALIVSPKDNLAKATVAHLSSIGYSIQDIMNAKVQWDAEDSQIGFPAGFLEDKGIIRNLMADGVRPRYLSMSVASLVEAVTIELGLFDEVKALPLPERQTSCLHALIFAAHDFEDACLRNGTPATIPAFIDYVHEVGITCGEDRDGVQLMTFHGSKGLQWKYVIVTSLDNDELEESKLISREVFGIHKDYVEQPSADNVYPEVFIRVCPWLFGSAKNVKDEFMTNAITSSDLFASVARKTRMQAANLLYVGMTRPSNALILAVDGFKWVDSVAPGMASITESGDILGTGDIFTDCTLSDTAAAEVLTRTVDQLPPRTVKFSEKYLFSLDNPRDVSPSGVHGFGRVLECEDVGARVPIADCDNMNIVGDCIHHIYSLADTCDASAFEALAQRIVANYGLSGVLTDPKAICTAWHDLVSRLTEKFGPAKTIIHERPFASSINGYCLTGSMDLVWVSEQGDVLVDFKLCPLGKSVVLDCASKHYVGLYAGQLDAYTSSLEAAGEKVIARLIFYPVSGTLVKVGESEVPALEQGIDFVAENLEREGKSVFDVTYVIDCPDFNISDVAAQASELFGEDIMLCDLTVYDDDPDEDDEDDDADEDDADDDNESVDYGDNFAVLAAVKDKSLQGVRIDRRGGPVSISLPDFGSSADCSIVYFLLVAIRKLYAQAGIFRDGNLLISFNEDLYSWFFESRISNVLALPTTIRPLIHGANRDFYVELDFFKKRYPEIKDDQTRIAMNAINDLALSQWQYLDYLYAMPSLIRGQDGFPKFLFYILDNSSEGVILSICNTVVLMLHETPIYLTLKDFAELSAHCPYVHEIDGSSLAIDPMPADEWENLCLSIACNVTRSSGAYLLLWDGNEPEDGRTLNPAKRHAESDDEGPYFRWTLNDFADVNLGDAVFFVNLNPDGGGVLLRGNVIVKPYVGADDDGKYELNMYTQINSIADGGAPVISLDRLRELLPDVELGAGKNILKLDSDSTARLREEWDKQISE